MKNLELKADWRSFVHDGILHLPDGLEERLDNGEKVVLASRSSSAGRKGRDWAARNLVDVVAQLKRQTGIDFTPALPSIPALVEMIADAEVTVNHEADGKSILHHFALIPLTLQVVALVATGSGSNSQRTTSSLSWNAWR